MKRKLFFAAVALVALASCTSDDFIGDVTTPQDNSPSESDAIVFSTASKGITRADIVGADAATLLDDKFVVGGFKGSSTAASTIVFDNYNVQWTENTAGKTVSNTSDWEYVGVAFNPNSDLYDATSTQTIKYWDYSQTLYDFVAYSLGQGTGLEASAINSTNHSFTIKGDEANLTKCYIADRVTVKKADFGKEVTLYFRNLASKVRVALYETIPGYSVKDVRFYTSNATDIVSDVTNTKATLIGSFKTSGTYTITYPGTTEGESDYNKAHVALAAGAASSSADYRDDFGSLVYTTAEKKEKETGNKYLKRSSNDPSFAGTSSTYYQTVLPNESGSVMELRINYTLEAIDGSEEEIKIYGAKAYVPTIYTQWLPNYAYTYIFKISDNTNGWTSTTNTDPAGLYPITFDAVVVDSEENTQTTITTVATPSITTYQKGHKYQDGPEYNASTTNKIYVQVMLNGALKGDLASKGQLYTLSEDKTEAEVLDALSIQESSDETTITGRNALVLTKATSVANFAAIPGEDGNDITITAGQAASFAATAGTYAYVYDTDTYNGNAVSFTTQPAGWPTDYYTDKACTTAASDFTSGTTYYQKYSYIYTAVETSGSAPDGWGTEGTWFKDPNGVTSAYGTTWAAGTYYKKYTVDSKIYGVKVIKVQ